MFRPITEPWPTSPYELLNEEEKSRLEFFRENDVDVSSALQTIDALWTCHQSRWDEGEVPLLVYLHDHVVQLSYRLAPGFVVTIVRTGELHGPFVLAARRTDETSVTELHHQSIVPMS